MKLRFEHKGLALLIIDAQDLCGAIPMPADMFYLEAHQQYAICDRTLFFNPSTREMEMTLFLEQL